MKGKLFKVINLILVFLVVIKLQSQENSISPLFAISNNGTSNILHSVNQVSGENLNIESFSSENYLGNNFTIRTLESSNVDKLFLLNVNNNLSVYDLPYFFDPNYSGQQNELVIANHISDLEYHHSTSNIFAYDLLSKNFSKLNSNTGQLITNLNIPFHSLEQDFSIKTTNDYAILCGKENDTTKFIFHNLLSNSNTFLSLETLFKDFKIVSNHQFTNLYAIAKKMNDENILLEINPSNGSVDSIANLNSCTSCNTIFSYDKNAMSLDSENNQLITVLNTNKNSTISYSLATYDLTDGSLIYSAPLSERISNLYYNKASADLIFPGDANHDGIVNVRDLISIGLRYSLNTISRFTQNIIWIGQHGFNTNIIVQGVDAKHADCNGDGQINEGDIEAIQTNYSFIHNSNKTISATGADCDYPLSFSFHNSAYESNDVQVNIKIGDESEPVSDIYAIAFTIKYDPDFVVENSMRTISLDSWFGIDNGTSIKTSVDNYSEGEIDVCVTGINLSNRSGGGDFVSISWTVEEGIISADEFSEQMNLLIDNIYIINYQEEELEGCGVESSITIHHKDDVGLTNVNDEKIEVYPNPAKDFIKILSEEKIKSVSLYSFSGTKVKSVSLNKNNKIDVSILNKGIYFIKIITEDSQYIEKIFIN